MFNSLKIIRIKSCFINILYLSIILIVLSGCSSIWLNDKKPKYSSYNECLVISVIGKGGSQDDDLKLSHVNCNNRYPFPVIYKNYTKWAKYIDTKKLNPHMTKGCGGGNNLYYITYLT